MTRLLAHPDFPCPSVTCLESEGVRSETGVIRLRYGLEGALDRVRLPRNAAPKRADDLWRHTCFEAFARAEGEAYLEINLSPSTEWAVYAFDGYRTGMRPVDLPPPRVEVAQADDRLELRASLDLRGLLPADAVWRIGLSAVIETTAGLSYWALRHPAGWPDFHHPDCFALELPATGGA